MPDVKPYKEKDSTKKAQVEEMFDNISGNYDFLNRLLSLNIDVLWRNVLVKKVQKNNPENILDIATGTGDLAIAFGKNTSAKIIGYDLSSKMLEMAKVKVQKNGLDETIELVKGDAENIPFHNDEFDVISAAFGVRNFEHLEKGLTEMYRVLKPTGHLYILEFSKPEGFFAPVFSFYFKSILPVVGKMISKDSSAYTYLPDSVEAFPHGKQMENILKKIGFKEVKSKKLTFGVSTIYQGIK